MTRNKGTKSVEDFLGGVAMLARIAAVLKAEELPSEGWWDAHPELAAIDDRLAAALEELARERDRLLEARAILLAEEYEPSIVLPLGRPVRPSEIILRTGNVVAYALSTAQDGGRVA